jgi:DNA-binding NtrC family response regulator
MEKTAAESRIAVLPSLVSGRIQIIAGSGRGQGVSLERGETIRIGRSPSSDLQLLDPKASSDHMEVKLGKRGFVVKDLDSLNGTYFGGAAIGELALGPGSELRVGSTYLLLTARGETPKVELSDRSSMGALVGDSVAMRKVYSVLESAAGVEVPVLIMGETGSGKELAARAIHEASSRSAGPFVIWDCGHAEPSQMASELFGAAASETAASAGGIAASAEGGTLFIDEIGELPEVLQPMLLRMVDSKKVKPVGSAAPREVDLRVIAATSRDIHADVGTGRFRQDLFYRLSVLNVTMPPLRDRKEDLPQLVVAICKDLGVEANAPLADKLLQELLQHSWPGNVRELRNALSSAAARGAKDFASMSIELAPATAARPSVEASFSEQKAQLIKSFEETFLRDLMESSGGNIRAACRASGLERTQLKRLLDKYGLRPSR